MRLDGPTVRLPAPAIRAPVDQFGYLAGSRLDGAEVARSQQVKTGFQCAHHTCITRDRLWWTFHAVKSQVTSAEPRSINVFKGLWLRGLQRVPVAAS